MMEDAATRGQSSWFRGDRTPACDGPVGSRTVSRSSSDHPSVSRARTFNCSICLRHLTTGSSSAAASWTERTVLVAAQEGQFMGGTFAEVSGAKIVGLVRAARDHKESAPDRSAADG